MAHLRLRIRTLMWLVAGVAAVLAVWVSLHRGPRGPLGYVLAGVYLFVLALCLIDVVVTEVGDRILRWLDREPHPDQREDDDQQQQAHR